MKYIATIAFIFAQYVICIAQNLPLKFSIGANSIGIITDPQGNVLGTGFVFQDPNKIVTCAHVAISDSLYFKAINDTKNQRHILRKLLSFPDGDITVLIANDSICSMPLIGGVPAKIEPGNQIVYVGYNKLESNSVSMALVVHTTNITACGRQLNEHSIANFFEFEGEAIPGYSGGPVFDNNGKVIGIIREAWTKRGLKGGKPILINRAFSIAPILSE